MDIHERLMAAMQSLDVLERDVRSCMAATRARFGIEHETIGMGTEERRQEDVANANMQVVLERRKELGRLWGLGLEEMKGDVDTAEVERLLTPLRLPDMTIWSESKQNKDSTRPNPERKSPNLATQKAKVDSVTKKKLAEKGRRVRPRGTSDLQYTSGHILRIFDPQEAISRVTRGKIAIEVEDGDDDSDYDEEELEETPLKPLSVASTGSNITVYRPPTPNPDEATQAVTKATSRMRKENLRQPARWQESSQRPASSRRSQRPPSVISISSQGTVESDRSVEIPGNPQRAFAPVAVEPQPMDGDALLIDSSDSPPMVRNSTGLEDDVKGSIEASIATTSLGEQTQPVTSTSDLSFATSSGTALFVSDKKRPKRSSMTVAEGMILGGSDSRIYFPTPSPAAGDHPPTGPARPIKPPVTSSKKRAKKRKTSPSVNPPEIVPDKRQANKRGKDTIDVGDLVTSPRRKQPSRATMKNGIGLLVGITSNDDSVEGKPLSWQAKGRGRGVTRAVPLNELARKGTMDDKK